MNAGWDGWLCRVCVSACAPVLPRVRRLPPSPPHLSGIPLDAHPTSMPASAILAGGGAADDDDAEAEFTRGGGLPEGAAADEERADDKSSDGVLCSAPIAGTRWQGPDRAGAEEREGPRGDREVASLAVCGGWSGQ